MKIIISNTLQSNHMVVLWPRYDETICLNANRRCKIDVLLLLWANRCSHCGQKNLEKDYELNYLRHGSILFIVQPYYP